MVLYIGNILPNDVKECNSTYIQILIENVEMA